MKRLYVVRHDVWNGQAHDLHGNPMVQTFQVQPPPVQDAEGNYVVAAKEDVIVPIMNKDLFDPRYGSHGIILSDGVHILLSASFDYSETAMELWHNHPEVARLPHPMYEGNVTLAELSTTAHSAKKFKAHHMAALANDPAIKAVPTDTVITLAKRAQAIHPLVKITDIT